MSANGSKSAKVRAQLNHPIIDTDGHTVEFTPVFFDYIKECRRRRHDRALQESGRQPR